MTKYETVALVTELFTQALSSTDNHDAVLQTNSDVLKELDRLYDIEWMYNDLNK